MTGTILFVISDNFDDLTFITCQTLLEEGGFDIILSSHKSGPCKGTDSSILTVSLQEAVDQNIDYAGLVLIGGDNLNNWELLNKTIQNFIENKLIIATIKDTAMLLKNGEQYLKMTEGIVQNENIVHLNDEEILEQFVNVILRLIS